MPSAGRRKNQAAADVSKTSSRTHPFLGTGAWAGAAAWSSRWRQRSRRRRRWQRRNVVTATWTRSSRRGDGAEDGEAWAPRRPTLKGRKSQPQPDQALDQSLACRHHRSHPLYRRRCQHSSSMWKAGSRADQAPAWNLACHHSNRRLLFHHLCSRRWCRSPRCCFNRYSSGCRTPR